MTLSKTTTKRPHNEQTKVMALLCPSSNSTAHQQLRRTLSELLITAVEGGSGYWAENLDVVLPADMSYQDEDIWGHNTLRIELNDREDPDIPLAFGWFQGINALGEHIAFKGLSWHQVMNDLWDFDAEDADAWLQRAALGDVVYG